VQHLLWHEIRPPVILFLSNPNPTLLTNYGRIIGYGYEDDETAPGAKSFTTTVGNYQNIAALNDALLGMKVGGLRRFAITPQKGWERPTKLCDGGPGGSGAGGDLKTDYVVVPTATMVSTESCFDQTKIPFPVSYAEQRRMAQRFDQSLIMEVQVVSVAKPVENGGSNHE
jgi:hypothetical protein